MVETRLTDTISQHNELITLTVAAPFSQTPYSSRYVVCAKQKTWRPFCTSLRRQHSGAPRYEFTVKIIHQRPSGNEITYRFLLLFHPSWHLRHCPVDGGIFVQVGQILAAENGQGLTSIQRPRPKRQFTHFYRKGRSINLFDLL